MNNKKWITKDDTTRFSLHIMQMYSYLSIEHIFTVNYSLKAIFKKHTRLRLGLLIYSLVLFNL